MYRIPCECGLVYIRETGRNLSKRLKEHKTNCEKAELDKSALAKHAWTYDHRIKWDEANILAMDSHRFSCKMRESIEIEKHNTIDQEGKPLQSFSILLGQMPKNPSISTHYPPPPYLWNYHSKRQVSQRNLKMIV